MITSCPTDDKTSTDYFSPLKISVAVLTSVGKIEIILKNMLSSRFVGQDAILSNCKTSCQLVQQLEPERPINIKSKPIIIIHEIQFPARDVLI